jgi:hypothetical protein
MFIKFYFFGAHPSVYFSGRDFSRIGRKKDIGPRRDKVTGESRRLRDEELHNMYYSQNNKMGETYSTHEREVHSGFWWGNLRKKRPLEKLTHI